MKLKLNELEQILGNQNEKIKHIEMDLQTRKAKLNESIVKALSLCSRIETERYEDVHILCIAYFNFDGWNINSKYILKTQTIIFLFFSIYFCTILYKTNLSLST